MSGLQYKGINLPPLNPGQSGPVAFVKHVFDYAYEDALLERVKSEGFNSVRLCMNVLTANDPGTLQTMKSLVQKVGGHALVCMVDTDTGSKDSKDDHGNGVVNDASEMADAWKKVHAVFGDLDGVLYEIFNEPFGYKDANKYMSEMAGIISAAGLPQDRCMINGMGYASDLASVVKWGWKGLLAWHLYPNWLPQGQWTQENYSNMIQKHLNGLTGRVFITEFGVHLNKPVDYDHYLKEGSTDDAGSVNTVRGLHDALLFYAKKGAPVRGAYCWHGAPNADSHDFFHGANAAGAKKVKYLLS